MEFDEKILASLTRRVEPTAYLRCTPIAHRTTPLGMGYGKTRFASPDDSFKLLYIAEDLPTSLAEAIVRDRFEGVMPREMLRSDFADWGVCEVSANMRKRQRKAALTRPFRLSGVSAEPIFSRALPALPRSGGYRAWR